MPAISPNITVLKKYIAILPEDKKSKAIVRMQRAFYVEPVREVSEGDFFVTRRPYYVKLVQIQKTARGTPKKRPNFLSTSIYGSFPADCNCPDYTGREDSKIVPCKHIWACLLQKYSLK